MLMRHSQSLCMNIHRLRCVVKKKEQLSSLHFPHEANNLFMLLYFVSIENWNELYRKIWEKFIITSCGHKHLLIVNNYGSLKMFHLLWVYSHVSFNLMRIAHNQNIRTTTTASAADTEDVASQHALSLQSTTALTTKRMLTNSPVVGTARAFTHLMGDSSVMRSRIFSHIICLMKTK